MGKPDYVGNDPRNVEFLSLIIIDQNSSNDFLYFIHVVHLRTVIV